MHGYSSMHSKVDYARSPLVFAHASRALPPRCDAYKLGTAHEPCCEIHLGRPPCVIAPSRQRAPFQRTSAFASSDERLFIGQRLRRTPLSSAFSRRFVSSAGSSFCSAVMRPSAARLRSSSSSRLACTASSAENPPFHAAIPRASAALARPIARASVRAARARGA